MKRTLYLAGVLFLLASCLIVCASIADRIVWQGNLPAGKYQLVQQDTTVTPPPDTTHTPPPDPGGELPPVTPPAGTVLYSENFEGLRPFEGWRGRNMSTNLTVQISGTNHFGRLDYQPHSDWNVNYRPRYQGVFDIRYEYSVRFPTGWRFKRDAAGQIIQGGKHFCGLSSYDKYAEGWDAFYTDGQCRQDFGAWGEFGKWDCTAYRDAPGGVRPGEFRVNLEQSNYFVPGRWHRVRIDLHLNKVTGDRSGKVDLYVDDVRKGGLGGEFNVIGAKGGTRVLIFGNMDNCEGEPWIDVDDIRVVAR